MAQYLKAEVRERILAAGQREFAARGFDDATMADIARAAGVSTGNLYRYFDGKAELLQAVVPASWVARFRALLRRRVESTADMVDVPEAGAAHPYAQAAAELLSFAIEHRLRVLILLKSTEASPLGNERERLTRELMKAALHHFGLKDPDARGPTFAFGLEEIYRNYVASLIRILARFENPDQIRSAIGTYERYHLVGLEAFFER